MLRTTQDGGNDKLPLIRRSYAQEAEAPESASTASIMPHARGLPGHTPVSCRSAGVTEPLRWGPARTGTGTCVGGRQRSGDGASPGVRARGDHPRAVGRTGGSLGARLTRPDTGANERAGGRHGDVRGDGQGGWYRGVRRGRTSSLRRDDDDGDVPPVTTYAALPPQVDLPALDAEVLAFWREHDVAARSLADSEGRPPWVFYEGPPTANGMPGTHHVEARVFKDVFPRYRTMKGSTSPARPAGTATACRSRSRWRRSWASPARATSRPSAWPSSTPLPGVGAAPRRRLRGDDRAHGLLGRHDRALRPWTPPTCRACGGRSSRSSTPGC
jgi:hypothetical protein